MSNEVHTLVKRRVVGSPTLKSVLLYMADAAADDGSGIWMAKGTIAADLEFKSKRTVQTALATLTEMGASSISATRSAETGSQWNTKSCSRWSPDCPKPAHPLKN